MDEDRMDELARDPRFVPGIYNYCDRWCERCEHTARCLNYAMGQEIEADVRQSRDAENEVFWGKLSESFEDAMEMDEPEDMDSDIDEEDLDESIREQEEVREAAQSQPFSRVAMKYIEIADNWLESNESLIGDASAKPQSPGRADTAAVKPGDATSSDDCVEVVRWYQRQIYVKLCRAASGAIRAAGDDLDTMQEDADGSAKVAIIGIERSMAAWATLLRRFPDHEDIIFALGTLKRLLRQVESAFPDARAFLRPGLDT